MAGQVGVKNLLGFGFSLQPNKKDKRVAEVSVKSPIHVLTRISSGGRRGGIQPINLL
jgi:hypothetical protein